MGEPTESDISHISGFIEGVLKKTEFDEPDTQFDEDRWSSLYGSAITYSSFPTYRDEEAMRNDNPCSIFAEWDAENETLRLKQGQPFPRDRPGTIVFANGTVATRTNAGKDRMHSLTEGEHAYIQRLVDARVDISKKVAW